MINKSRLSAKFYVAVLVLIHGAWSSTALGQSTTGNSLASLASAGTGVGMNAMGASTEYTKCTADKSDPTACVLAGLFVVTGAAMAASALSAGNSAAATNSGSDFTPDLGTTADTTNGILQNGLSTTQSQAVGTANAAALNSAIQALNGAGYTMNSDGVTMPNGTTVSSKGNLGANLMAAGFSPAQVAAAEKNLKDLKDKAGPYSVAAVPVETGGGGGGGAGSANIKPFDFDFHHTAFGATNRAPTSVAGMSKSFHGEPIGVSQDGIFDMIMRRYQMEQKDHAFLDR